MNRGLFSSIFLCLVAATIILLFPSSCTKEYSFEGAPVDSVEIDSNDLPQTPGLAIPKCSSCIEGAALTDWKWNFKIDSTFICGVLDTAIMNIERNAFTFFGPSSCSSDTGLIISAYLNNQVLNRDQRGVTTDRVAFYYYDNVGQTFILVSQPGTRFTLTLDSYNHSNGLSTGRLSGSAYTEDGKKISVTSGNFQIYLK